MIAAILTYGDPPGAVEYEHVWLDDLCTVEEFQDFVAEVIIARSSNEETFSSMRVDR